MQPYLFPYIGYFQAISSVDKFVIYDDVNYIKQGWINRNRIVVNNEAHFITLELIGSSSFKKINEIQTGRNKNKIIKTIESYYKRAPFFEEIFELLKNILSNDENNLAKFLANSLLAINLKLGIDTTILISSEMQKNNQLKGQDKVIHICNLLNATTYINAIGGQELYSKKVFDQNGIELKFIKSNQIEYKQFNSPFISNLSIIDVMMNCGISETSKLIKNYELI